MGAGAGLTGTAGRVMHLAQTLHVPQRERNDLPIASDPA
jgi:hypothetical protein